MEQEERIVKKVPHNFQDCFAIVKLMRIEGKILVSFESLDRQDFKKSIFFLAGAASAYNGQMRKITPKKFLFYFN